MRMIEYMRMRKVFECMYGIFVEMEIRIEENMEYEGMMKEKMNIEEKMKNVNKGEGV